MDDEFIQEFINESREHLATIETDLLTIEEGGVEIDEDLVNKVFRAAHSIKGSSSYFGLDKVKELAHMAETVLDLMRARKMVPNAEVINILLVAFDQLREMINNPGQSGSADIADLVVNLTGLASSCLSREQKGPLNQNVTFRCEGDGFPVTLPKVDFDRVQRSNRFIYYINYDLIHDIDEQGKNVLEVFRDLCKTGDILDCVLDYEAAGTLDDPAGNQLPLGLVFSTIIQPGYINIIFSLAQGKIKVLFDPHDNKTAPLISAPVSVSVHQSSPPPVKDEMLEGPPKPKLCPPTATSSAVKSAKAAPSPPSPVDRVPASIEETLRINVKTIESLMNLTGELVLSRNQLRAAIDHNDERSLAVSEQRINQVTSELQDAVMQTRLQPVGNVFAKFSRLVRDMANALQKKIRLDIRGQDVALDKSLIEGLSDPLTHMVRNAVDHGIETPEERSRAGKTSEGTIRIEARHEAGHVVFEIADDGKGIDPDLIAQSAERKGLITSENLQRMSDQDKAALIFLPGLSTADKVTDISGRGVGMDVVKTNLARLGGKVEIASKVGKGTLFTIKLPLTLAIIPSLIVSVEGECFAVPQINIEKLLCVQAEEAKKRIEVVGDVEVLVLREQLIPLVRFADLLGVTPTYIDSSTGALELDRRKNLADRRSPRHPVMTDPDDVLLPSGTQSGKEKKIARCSDGRRRAESSTLEIAVVSSGTIQYGLVLDKFHNTEEIVVKPLGRHLKDLHEYAGATILGDGTVALILDVAGLAAKAALRPVSGTVRAREQAKKIEQENFEDSHSLLLFHNAPDELCAMPLDTVLRIERITPAQVEMVGNRRTMQYRGGMLPLVMLSDTAQVGPLREAKELAVIVFSVRNREVGLLGAMPVGMTEVRIAIDQGTHRQTGIAGSAIISGRTALIADVFELVDVVYPEWKLTKASLLPGGDEEESPTVLLAEDSDFFRTQIKRFLEEEGYTVFDAPDGEAAWDLLLEHVNEVRAVVTDIEMPRLTGLELTRRIRAYDLTVKLPVIAITTLAGKDDIDKGMAAGINDYQVKLDRDQLLDCMRTYMMVGA